MGKRRKRLMTVRRLLPNAWVVWPGLVWAFRNPALGCAFSLLMLSPVIGSLCADRLATHTAPVSPYEAFEVGRSRHFRWVIAALAALVQPLLWWAIQAEMLPPPIDSSQLHAWGQPSLPYLLELLPLVLLISGPLGLRWRKRVIQIDAAGIRIPTLAAEPIAWQDITAIEVKWFWGYPTAVLSLAATSQSAVGRQNKVVLYGRDMSADELCQAIFQRWQAFGGPRATVAESDARQVSTALTTRIVHGV
jgi:hypothetical protein